MKAYIQAALYKYSCTLNLLHSFHPQPQPQFYTFNLQRKWFNALHMTIRPNYSLSTCNLPSCEKFLLLSLERLSSPLHPLTAEFH